MKVTCGVFIINSDKKILLTHPTGFNNNYWSIPKGLSDINETHIDAAIREVYEETGLILDKNKVFKLGPLIKYNKKNKYLCSFYTISSKDISDYKIYCNSMVYKNNVSFPENDMHCWATYEQALKMLHYTQIKPLMFLKYLNKI